MSLGVARIEMGLLARGTGDKNGCARNDMSVYDFEQRTFSLPSHTAATRSQRTEQLSAGVTSFRSQQALTKLLPSHGKLIHERRHKTHQGDSQGGVSRAAAPWAPQDQVLGANISTEPGGCCSGEDLWGFSLVGMSVLSAHGCLVPPWKQLSVIS